MFNLLKKFTLRINNSITIDTDIPISTPDIEKENNPSLENTIGGLKNKNDKFIEESKNSDYERNLFLYETGFVKMKRVVEFINTINMIGNIENYKIIEKKYSKYNLELINSEMLQVIKSKFNFRQEKNSAYEGYMPDIAIDTLKRNYLLLKTDRLVCNLYSRYYTHGDYSKDTAHTNEWVKSHYSELSKSLIDVKEYYYNNSNYYILKIKDLEVCYKHNKGMVLLEIEPNHYFILCDWSDIEGNNLTKMNFKNFIQSETK